MRPSLRAFCLRRVGPPLELHSSSTMRQLWPTICVAAFLATATGVNVCLDYTDGNKQFKCAAGVTMIKLAGCGITDSDTLDIGACFENAGQDSIDIIYLNDNELSLLPADLFQGLGALQALYLGGNPFTELDAALFSGLTSLERLWVNGCALTSLPVGLFDGLTGLVQLFFHKNKLESLPTGLFGDDLDALHHLDLRENALVTLPAEIFQKLQALSTLNLSGNKISTLPAGLFPGRLEYLFLADNELSGQGALDPGAFEGLGRLLTLTLSNNELEALPSGLFSDLESLTVLGLAGNSDLQCVPSTVGSSSLADDKIILPVGFAFGGVCSCPGDEVCDDCVDGELGYICTGCGEKANECQLDRTCQECRLPANDQEQATWDACINQFAFGATCSAVSATACCFDELSANDCFRNDAFVTYSTCLAEALSENECTSLSCGDIETNAFSSSSSPSSEGTSGGVRFRNALVGCAVGSTVAGLVSVVGIFVWA